MYRSVIVKNIIAEQNSGYNLSVWYCTYKSLIVQLFKCLMMIIMIILKNNITTLINSIMVIRYIVNVCSQSVLPMLRLRCNILKFTLHMKFNKFFTLQQKLYTIWNILCFNNHTVRLKKMYKKSTIILKSLFIYDVNIINTSS